MEMRTFEPAWMSALSRAMRPMPALLMTTMARQAD